MKRKDSLRHSRRGKQVARLEVRHDPVHLLIPRMRGRGTATALVPKARGGIG